MKLYGGSGKRKTNSAVITYDEDILTDLNEDELTEPDLEPEKDQAMRKEAVQERGRTKKEQEEIDELIAKYQKHKKRKRIVILAVIITILACGYFLYRSFVKPPDIDDSGKGGWSLLDKGGKKDGAPATNDNRGDNSGSGGGRIKGMYTLLLVGFDKVGANTDTLMMCRFDTVNNKVNIISLPRDTCANVKYPVKKINAVYAYGGGIDALMNAVSDITGFKIDNYVMVDIDAFVALVNAIGGVYYDIPYNMNYDDPTQDLHIHFNKGYQYLTGEDAIKVVRWRQNNDQGFGDIVRIENQQNFLKAVVKQCLSLSNIVTKTDDYVKIFNDYVKTDLTIGNLGWFAQQFLKLKEDSIEFGTVPANYYDSVKGFSYGFIYVDQWLEEVNKHLNPYNEPITIDDVNIISRDENGNLYATTGEIAGGYESFADIRDYTGGGSNSSGSSAPAATQAPAVTDTPVVTEAPEVSETPALTESPAITDNPELTNDPELSDNPEVTDDPELSDNPEVTDSPDAAEEPAETEDTVSTAEPAVTETTVPADESGGN